MAWRSQPQSTSSRQISPHQCRGGGVRAPKRRNFCPVLEHKRRNIKSAHVWRRYQRNNFGLIFRPHRARGAQNAAFCYRCLSVCVCVCVCWSPGCALQKRPNRSRCRLWAGLCVLAREGATFRVVWPSEKHWESLLQKGSFSPQWRHNMQCGLILLTVHI